MNKSRNQSKDDRPLRTLRENAGLTQTELAKQVGCPRSAITGYEVNKYEPSLSRAVALARSLNVSLKQLAQAMNIDITGVPNDEPRDTI